MTMNIHNGSESNKSAADATGETAEEKEREPLVQQIVSVDHTLPPKKKKDIFFGTIRLSKTRQGPKE